MSKVVVSMFLSLDGFVVGPREEMDWVINNFDIEGMGADMSKLQANAGTFLLGRQTYQIMAGAWPNQTETTSPGAEVMNNTPKLVASNTLKETPWGKYANATLLRGDTLREIRKLKEKPGKDIVTFGSPKLVQRLKTHFNHSIVTSATRNCCCFRVVDPFARLPGELNQLVRHNLLHLHWNRCHFVSNIVEFP